MKKQLVLIEDLPVISSPEEFFSTDLVLLIDFSKLGTAEDPKFGKVICDTNVFFHNGDPYYSVVLVGEPQNFFINATRGIPFATQSGYLGVYTWDGKLMEDIAKNRFCDVSQHQKAHKAGKVEFGIGPHFPVRDQLELQINNRYESKVF